MGDISDNRIYKDMVVVFLMLAVSTFFISKSFSLIRSTYEKSELIRQEAQILNNLRIEYANSLNQLKYVSSSDFIEGEVRRVLGWAYPGEYVFVLPDSDNNASIQRDKNKYQLSPLDKWIIVLFGF